MLTELFHASYQLLQPLLPQPCFHLAVESILAGKTPARVLVDRREQPRSAMLWAGHHVYLAGDLENPDWQASLNRLFLDPPVRHASDTRRPTETGEPMLELFHLAAPDDSPAAELPTPAIDAAFRRILAGLEPILDRREYYAGAPAEIAAQAEPAPLPPGLHFVPVDRRLLANERLEGLDELKDEMMSERPSVKNFLARSFGVACVDETANALAGWCLSEYNLPGRCEVGIETVEAYQRHGLGTAMGRALAAEAHTRAIHTVGWHCFANNAASAATARKIGLKLAAVYPIYYFWYQPSVKLAAHGIVALHGGQYAEALDWCTRSLAYADAPHLADWGAGCACAGLGDASAAFDHLANAIAKGFTYSTLFESSPHLASLRDDPRWAALIESLR